MNSDRKTIKFVLPETEFSTFYSLLISVELKNDQSELTLAFHHFGVLITGENLKPLADKILAANVGEVKVERCDEKYREKEPERVYAVTGVRMIEG